MLSAGRGQEFRRAIRDLIEELRSAIPDFEGGDGRFQDKRPRSPD
jgi:hypothetical protein